jgi:hypothetical protein
MGVRFGGTEGMIEATAYPWRARSEPESLITSEFSPGGIRHDSTAAHGPNFPDCVKSRGVSAAPGEMGPRSASVCHLGNVAIRLGGNVKWLPEQERFPGDDEANEVLLRPMRAPSTPG